MSGRKNYLISFDPTVNKWESVKNSVILHPSDRFIKIFEGAIIVSSYTSSKEDVLKSLLSHSLTQFLITPVSIPPLDGATNEYNWDYLKKNML